MKLIDLQELIYSNRKLSVETLLVIIRESVNYYFFQSIRDDLSKNKREYYRGNYFMALCCFQLLNKVDRIKEEEQEDQQ